MCRFFPLLALAFAALVALTPAALTVAPSAEAAQPGTKKGTNYAFMVAGARYTHIQPIEGEETINDILEFKKALLETGFDEANIVVMHDRQAEKGGQGARFLPEVPIAGEERSFEIAAGVKMVFCWLPPGEAQLGSPKAERDAVWEQVVASKLGDAYEKIVRELLESEAMEKRGKFRTKGFWLGKYTVTQEEWQAVMGDNPSYFDGKKDNKAKGMDTHRFPVELVSWNDCQKFLDKVNGRGGVAKVFGSAGRFALPHEDQWEYACRGGKGNDRAYYWGDELNGTQANCNSNYPFGSVTKGPQYLERTTCAVDFTNGGRYEKHPWGLFHMSGNVYQWCSNMYDSKTYVLRGGSWNSYARNCRSASRLRNVPGIHGLDFGFRVCLP